MKACNLDQLVKPINALFKDLFEDHSNAIKIAVAPLLFCSGLNQNIVRVQLMDKSLSFFTCLEKTNEVERPADQGETADQLVWPNFNYNCSMVKLG